MDLIVQVHGGAWDIPDILIEPHQRGVLKARQLAYDLFDRGAGPLDIVVSVLKMLEDDPVFDAGTGSFLNEHGDVELDAAVMEGVNLKAGAVAGISNFSNPSSIALAVLRDTEHVLLVGSGAEAFALKRGFKQVSPIELVHEREVAAYHDWLSAGRPSARVFFAKPASGSLAGAYPDRRGTVGVVLGVRRQCDGGYDLFTGSSTGGIPGKMAGRVGDVPLVGCGLYADNETAAVSCSGWGEGLIRTAAARAVSERIRSGLSPQESVEHVLKDLWRRTEGRGGIIAIGHDGQQGAAFTTPAMAYAGPGCRFLQVS